MSANGRVAGKTALVTGAASGLGAETARRLAANGANVMLTDRDPTGAEVAVAIGNTADFTLHDVASEDDWAAAVAVTTARFGGLDILVNNAGVAGSSLDLLTHSLDDWRRILSINLDGVFLGLRHCGPVMAAHGRGSVINLSSILGKVGMAGAAAYCASKGGLNMLTKVMTVEWARHNIQINTVCPTVILTPMGEKVWGQPEKGDPMLAKIPGARFGKPVEVADAILYLASSASDMICGHDLMVDGGYTAV